MSFEFITRLISRASSPCADASAEHVNRVASEPAKLSAVSHGPSTTQEASAARLGRTNASPAGPVREPNWTPDRSGWDRLKAGVLRAALVTACVVTTLVVLSIPVSWVLVGGLLLGVTIAHVATALVDRSAARDNANLAAARSGG